MGTEKKFVVQVVVEEAGKGFVLFDEAGNRIRNFKAATEEAGASVRRATEAFDDTSRAAHETASSFSNTAASFHDSATAASNGVATFGRSAEDLTATLQGSISLMEIEIDLQRQVAEGTISTKEAAVALARARALGDEQLADLLAHEAELGLELERARKAAEGAGKSFDEGARTATLFGRASSFTVAKLAGIATAAAAAGTAIAGISSVFGGAAEAAHTFREASRLDVDASFLSEFTQVAALAGKGMDQVVTSIQDVRERAGEALDALADGELTNTFVQSFAGIGILPDQLRAIGDDTEQVVEIFFQKVLEAAESGNQVLQFRLQEISSSGFEGFGGALLALGDNVDQVRETIRNLGSSFDDETAALSNAAVVNFSLAGQALTGVRNELLAGMAPALVGITQDFLDVAVNAGIAGGGVRDLGGDLGELLHDGLRPAVDGLREFIEEVRGGESVAGAFSGLIGELTADLFIELTPLATNLAFELAGHLTLAFAEELGSPRFSAAVAGAGIGTLVGGPLGAAIGFAAVSSMAEIIERDGGPTLAQKATDLGLQVSDAFNAAVQGGDSEAGFAQIDKLEREIATLEEKLGSRELLLELNFNPAAEQEVLDKITLLKSELRSLQDTAAAALVGPAIPPEILRTRDQLTASARDMAEQTAKAQASVSSLTAALVAGRSGAGAMREAAAAAEATGEGFSAAQVAARLYAEEQAAVLQSIAQYVDDVDRQIAVTEASVSATEAAVLAGGTWEGAQRAGAEAAALVAREIELERVGLDQLIPRLRASAEAEREAAEAARARIASAQLSTETQELEFQIGLYDQVISRTITLEEAQRQVAVRQEAQRLSAMGYAGNIDAAAAAMVGLRTETAELQDAAEAVGDSFIRLGDTIRTGVADSLEAILFNRDFSSDEFWRGLGVSAIRQFSDAFLADKVKLFDVPVNANWVSVSGNLESSLLDSGRSALSGLGSLFSGGGSSGNGTASSSGFSLGNLLLPGGGGELTTTTFSDPHLLPGEEIIGSAVMPGGSPGVIVRDSLGNEKILPKDATTTFNVGNAVTSTLGGAVGGFGGAQFGNQFINDTSLPSFFGSFESDILDRAHTINEILSAIIGGVTGLAGGGALGGGVVGILSSVFGDMLLDDLSLKDFENGQFSNSLLPALGTIFAGPFAFSGAGNDFFNSLGFDLLGLPRTRGGAIRSGLEPFLNESEALQRFLPAFNFNRFSGEQVGDLIAPGRDGSINRLIEQRGIDASTFTQIRGMGEALFGDIARELEDEQLGDTAFNAGLILAESMTQGVERGMNDAEILEASTAALRAFAEEQGVTFRTAIERASHLQEAFNELGRVDGSPGNAEQEGFDAFGRSIAGAIEIFEQDFPAGTQVGLVALQSLARDGAAAFADLTAAEKEAVLGSMMPDFDSMAALFAELSSRGFEIDLSVFDDLLKSSAASASFVGENLVSSLQSAGGNAELAVRDMLNKLGGLVSDSVFGEALTQLFDTTAIGQAFSPVFDVLGRVDEFDLTSQAGVRDVSSILVSAIQEGETSFREYLPILRELITAAGEFDEILQEALEPTKAEQAIAVVESAFGNLGSAASSAVETGLAVMEETGSYERGLAAFTSVFVTGAEENLKQAVLSALIDATVLQPIIDRFQPAFSFIVAAGMEHGFDDPRVQAAWQQQLALLRADVAGAAPLIFDANIEFATSSGGDFGAVLVQQVEQAQAEIRGVFGNAVGAGLAEIERVIADGGRTRSAIAKGSKVFAEAFGDSIQESTTAAITSAITQGVILEGRLAPLLAELRLKTAAALDDGVITAAERADLSALGGKIVAEGHRAAGELTPVFQEIGLISLDVQNLDEVSKQAQRLAQKHGLLPADVEQFLRAAEGVDPDALAEFFELLADAERPFREAAQKFRAVDDSIDERTLINFFKAAEGVDPDKLTSYFSALVEHEESLRNASIWYAEITGVDQETLLGFFRAAEGVDPEALTAYFQALEARDAAEAGEAKRRATSFADLQDAAVGLQAEMSTTTTATAELAFAASTAAAELRSISAGVGTVTDDTLLRANGGPVGAFGSAIVGEAGEPELVVDRGAAGFDVIPLDRATAAAMMAGGIPGFANGTIPRTGGGTLVNQQEIDRLRAENLRLKREAKGRSSGGGDGIAQLVSPNLSSTIGDFLLGGVESVSDDVTASVGGSILDGVTQGFLEAEATKSILEPLNKAVVDAMSDGVLSAAEAESIKSLGKSASAGLTAAIEDMGPAFKLIAEAFGLGIETEVIETVDPIKQAFDDMIAGIAPSLEGGIGGSIERALLNGTLRGADDMGGFLKQTVGSSVLGALVNAFVTSGALGAQIQRFAQIAGAQVELLMTGVFTQAQFDTVMEGMTRDFINNVGPMIDIIQDSLGPLQDFFGVDFAGTVNDSVRPIVDDANAVVDASKDLCTAKCDLVRQTTELSDIGLNLAGARGNISIESFVPRHQIEHQERLASLTARGLMAQEAFDAYLAENGLTGNRFGHKAVFLRQNPEFVGVPFLADGGVAVGATLAVVGEKENELVLPFSRIPEVLPRIAEAVSSPQSPHDSRIEALEREVSETNRRLDETNKKLDRVVDQLGVLAKVASRGFDLNLNEEAAGRIVSRGEYSNARARR